MKEKFKALLQEYRRRNYHFLHLVTANRNLFLILDDSYYLTYRDDKKEVALSLPLLPKDKSHEKIFHYNTNKRALDEWYNGIVELYETMEDKEFYHAPNYNDIQINYVNENEKVPLKDFLAVIPKTEYIFSDDYILFDEIGTGFDKEEKNYFVEESGINPLVRYWLNFEEMKPFNYVVAEPVKSLAIRLDSILEIVPGHTNTRFIFDNGSVKVLRRILDEKED